MPGKQMAIDADLNTGAITDKEAKERREKIQKESSFFGAMDGATKYVKGDATAGIIITLINLVGGTVMGVMFQGLDASEAIQKFGLLTIGDRFRRFLYLFQQVFLSLKVPTRMISVVNFSISFLELQKCFILLQVYLHF